MSGLSSFPLGLHAVLIGHSGGIGQALLAALLADPAVAQVTAAARRKVDMAHDKLRQLPLDITDEASIAAFAAHFTDGAPPRLVIVASGLLHDGMVHQPEKSLRSLNAEQLQRSFMVNSIGPALLGKYLLPLLPRSGKSVCAFLSARVGSISDNVRGGWYGYRASKAALNMIVKTFSIELQPRWPEAICVALHPGTVDTALSLPFQAHVVAGRLFSPTESAVHLLAVIDRLERAASGRIFAWDGQEIMP